MNAAYAKKPKKKRKPYKKREYFPGAQKYNPKDYPKVNPDNEKYRDVMRAAAQAYRALSPDEKLERIRIAYKESMMNRRALIKPAGRRVRILWA